MAKSKSNALRGGERSAFWMCLALACATPALGGCSLILTSGPSAAEAAGSNEPVRCSTSRFPPILDTLFASGQVGRVVLAAASDERDYRKSPISKEADIIMGVILGGLFIVSAVHGYSATSECAEAKERWWKSLDTDSPAGGRPVAATAERPAAARAESPTNKPPPVSGAGFELGKPIALAEERCTGAQFAWQALDDGQLACSGAPADLGVPVTVKLAVCEGAVCKVTANASADRAPWRELVSRFTQIFQVLEREHGVGYQRSTKAINGCTDGIPGCFAAGSVRTTVTWRWPNKQVVSLVLDGGPPESGPVLGVVYATGALFEGDSQTPR